MKLNSLLLESGQKVWVGINMEPGDDVSEIATHVYSSEAAAVEWIKDCAKDHITGFDASLYDLHADPSKLKGFSKKEAAKQKRLEKYRNIKTVDELYDFLEQNMDSNDYEYFCRSFAVHEE